MTCIVGLVDKGTVFMGGDSCGSDGWGSEVFAGPKVFKVGPFLVGYTTAFRMGQVLEHSLTLWRKWDKADEIGLYMRTGFIDSVRSAFKLAGWSREKDSQEFGGQFLVGVNGRLFEVHDDYSVLEPSAGYTAVGSGYLAAKGAMAALEAAKVKMAPAARLRISLQAAEKHVAGVKGPFTVLEMAA